MIVVTAFLHLLLRAEVPLGKATMEIRQTDEFFGVVFGPKRFFGDNFGGNERLVSDL